VCDQCFLGTECPPYDSEKTPGRTRYCLGDSRLPECISLSRRTSFAQPTLRRRPPIPSGFCLLRRLVPKCTLRWASCGRVRARGPSSRAVALFRNAARPETEGFALPAARASAHRFRLASVPSPGPVPAPGPDASFGVMLTESLRSSDRFTRRAGSSASRTLSRLFADLRFRRRISPAHDWVLRNDCGPRASRMRNAASPVPTATGPSGIPPPSRTAGTAERSEASSLIDSAPQEYRYRQLH
jgi:hypothetical protein